jgi:deoxyribose-phosphate aldolase
MDETGRTAIIWVSYPIVMSIMDFTYQDLAKMIDHSLLNPSLSMADLEKGVQIALAYDVASVCIMPYALKWLDGQLAGSDVKTSTTIGFPHGGQTTSIKVAEAIQALEDGGEELDMVVNISRVLSGDWKNVLADIRSVIEVTHERGGKVKVIFENAYLDDQQKIKLCEICGELKADWVKTSTGYAPSGATDADLILMRKHSPATVQVKAAEGVRSLDRLLAVRALGVSRAGATATVTILEEAKRRLGLPHDSSPSGPIVGQEVNY